MIAALILTAALTADIHLTACLTDGLPDDAAFSTALVEAIGGGTVYLGPGVLILERYPAELRHITGEPNKRLDVTIVGTPGETIIRGVGRAHDVIQLNAVAGVTLRNLVIESASVVGPNGPGCNGVSITNGSADVLCDNVTVRGLPFFATGSRFDGSKAFTVQQAGGKDRSSVVFRDCTVIDCAIAFGIDVDPKLGCPTSIIIDGCSAHGAVVGVAVSFAYGPEPKGFKVDVLGSRFTDCKRPLVLSRAYDVRFVNNAVSTVQVPAMPDPFNANFGECAVAIKGCTRIEITGNTFVEKRPTTLFSVTSSTGPAQPSGAVTTEPNIISR